MNSKKQRFTLLAAVALAVFGAGPFLRFGLTRGPYLQEASATNLVIRWRTARPVRSEVSYGLSPSELSWTTTSNMRGTDHAVLLSGLQPATTYYYRVSTWPGLPWANTRVHQFVTPPEAGSATPVRVWVLGDAGTAGATQKGVRDAFARFSAGRSSDLCLLLGDNAYREGTDAQYQRALFDFYPDLLARTTFWPTIGNHDARSADSVTETGVYFDVFNLPSHGQCGGVMSGTEAYYSFDYANVHFVCLDSEGSSRATNGPMLTWLHSDLAANQQMWTIAFWHQPPYTCGSHRSDYGKAMQELRERALPLLEQAGVDLVLGGHSHSYERSYLIDGHYGNSQTFSPSMIKGTRNGLPDPVGPYAKPAGAAAAHSGTIYVVAGSAGQTGGLEASPHPAMCVSLNTAGSLVLDIAGPRLDATFLDVTSHARDRFSILKGHAPDSEAQAIAAHR